MNDRQQLLARVLALSLLLTLLEHWRVLRIAIGPLLGVASSAMALLVTWTWLVLMGFALAGLTNTRRWGAWAVAVLAPVSTILMAISLVPGSRNCFQPRFALK